jgi:hypothetical protein
LCDPFTPGRITDDQRGLGIADEVLQLSQRIGGVEGKIYCPSPDSREIQDQRRHRLLHLNSNPVARPDPTADQHVGQTA